ncbi:MAG: A/G-specific adenine glycosylase [Rhodospirillales bacterium]
MESTIDANVKGNHLVRRLLAWYDRHGRPHLPWRAAAGEPIDPYRVWISEIMLQQTTVATVIPYFEAFVTRWPGVHALAAAPLDDVLHAWAGLGYYARARHLHGAAAILVREHGGRFPQTVEGLRRLPGFGAYTAAAVAAIAFGARATPVDGNVVRVLARVFRIETPLPAARRAIEAVAAGLAPAERPGDFAQALMDLGATVCLPRRPRCLVCPWQGACAAHAAGIAESLPVKPAACERPRRHGVAFWAERPDGAVLFRRRPPQGLLGGLMEVPSTPWRAEPWALEDAIRESPPALSGPFVSWRPLDGAVEHVFTHFALRLSVVRAAVPAGAATPGTEGGRWIAPDAMASLALPTLMRKVVRLARGGADGA